VRVLLALSWSLGHPPLAGEPGRTVRCTLGWILPSRSFPVKQPPPVEVRVTADPSTQPRPGGGVWEWNEADDSFSDDERCPALS